MKQSNLDYILEETYISLKKCGFLNIISVITITITLFIFGTFLLLEQNLQLMLKQWRVDIHLIAFLEDNRTESEYANFTDELRKKKGVLKVNFVSKNNAKKMMVNKGYGFLLDQLDENPLPASVEVTFDIDSLSNEEVNHLVEFVRSKDMVESVSYGGGFFESLTTAIWVLKTMGIFLVIIYAIASIFIIATTNRLTIYTRFEEIRIMRLVGASSWFIRWPFIFGSVLVGFFGSLLAIIFLFMMFHFMTLQLDFASLAVIGLKGIVFFKPVTILVMVLAGIAVGSMGSILSLRKVVAL